MYRRMNQVLDRVKHDGRRNVDDVQESLDSQDIFTVRLKQHAQPNAEGRPIERAIESESKSGDVGVVPVHVDPVVVMVVMVVVMVVNMIVVVGVRVIMIATT